MLRWYSGLLLMMKNGVGVLSRPFESTIVVFGYMCKLTCLVFLVFFLLWYLQSNQSKRKHIFIICFLLFSFLLRPTRCLMEVFNALLVGLKCLRGSFHLRFFSLFFSFSFLLLSEVEWIGNFDALNQIQLFSYWISKHNLGEGILVQFQSMIFTKS